MCSRWKDGWARLHRHLAQGRRTPVSFCTLRHRPLAAAWKPGKGVLRDHGGVSVRDAHGPPGPGGSYEDGSSPLARQMYSRCFDSTSVSSAYPSFWSAWDRGAWRALLVANYLLGVSVEGPGPDGIRSGWDQDAKGECVALARFG